MASINKSLILPGIVIGVKHQQSIYQQQQQNNVNLPDIHIIDRHNIQIE